MRSGLRRMARSRVAPFTGAWIEIMSSIAGDHGIFVAPFTGAWIEICVGGSRRTAWRSLPSRERGLKYWQACYLLPTALSLPSRERGLK